jgi:CheY-like chemotaxis protein/signal transduction histidine kinase
MSGSQERENRSVNDFHSAEDLRRALKSSEIQRSEADGQHVSFRNPAVQEQQDIFPIAEDETVGANSASEDVEGLDQQLDWVLENYDQETTEAQSLDDELRRLLVLRSYLVLDSERQESFERVTGLASRIFKCPMSLISLVDLGRQWFMSNRGLGDTRETKRKYAFCAHAIMGKEDFLIVPDTTKDPRFNENPLVTGPPDIKFYAGVPLLSPEGYKLGTLCVLDIEPRPEGLSLEEKQNLIDLAALAVQALVDQKRHKVEDFNDPAQLIAYTSHDLLTPLTGVQLSLSLLMEDEDFSSKLTPQQREMITTASSCTDVMGRICQTSLDSFRKNKKKHGTRKAPKPAANFPKAPAPIIVSDFVKSLYMVIDAFPKRVPLIITVHPSVPEAIIADDLKVFRAAINYLTNACAKTETGSVHLSINTEMEGRGRRLVFECEDTGEGVPVEKYPHLFRPYKNEFEDDEVQSCLQPLEGGGFDVVTQIQMPNSGLGLYSVAVHISSIGGEYGFRPRGSGTETAPNGKPVTGSIFWFQIPLVVPSEGATAAIDLNGNKRSNIMRNFSNLSSSLREISEEYEPNRRLQVLGTPTMSQAQATKVYNAFTKVLEGEVPAGIADINEAVGAVKTAECIHSEAMPQVKDEKPEAKPMKEAVPVKKGVQRQRRALVIEDSLVVRKTLTRVLTKLGFEAVQAVDGMVGLKELQGSLFDVVLCDFLMPVMDGLDCVQQYREWEKIHRPFFQHHIIGISAHAGEKDVARGIEVGMDDFKPKPVTYKQLADLDKSKELKIIGDRLDEIAAAGTMMIDMNSEKEDDAADHMDEVETSKGGKKEVVKHINPQSSNTSIHFCLIAVEQGKTATTLIEKAAKDKGWKTVIVHNGEDALRLMKMRNWDAILLDEDLPVLASPQCIARFRDWEERNRVNRQRNVVLLSASIVSMAIGSKSMVQLPFGFDLSLGKPIRINEFEYIMARAQRSETEFGVRDIVHR